jgi:dolichol-phosphate mannosyltransferase
LRGVGAGVTNPRISLVIPIYNEAGVLEALFARLKRSLTDLPAAEILFVNDGSTDDSLSRLTRFLEEVPETRIINLSRNFGHQSALMAGITHARGEAVILMDGDLQDPPEVLPELIEKWNQGAEIIVAARKSRKERGVRRLLFPLFYKLFSFLSDFPFSVSSGIFGLMDRKAVDEIVKLEECNRYIPGLRNWIGFKTAVVWYDREERAEGAPKQDLLSLMKYGADAVFSFSYKPLRLSLLFGLCISALSFFYGALLVVLRLLEVNYVKGFTTTTVAIFFLGGLILISNGILGEYLGRVYDEVKRRPLFIVSEIISRDSPKNTSHGG